MAANRAPNNVCMMFANWNDLTENLCVSSSQEIILKKLKLKVSETVITLH